MVVTETYAETRTRRVWKCDMCMRTMRAEKDMSRLAVRHLTGTAVDGKPIAHVTQWHLCWRCAFELEDRMNLMRRTRASGLTPEEQQALLRDLDGGDEPRKRRGIFRNK